MENIAPRRKPARKILVGTPTGLIGQRCGPSRGVGRPNLDLVGFACLKDSSWITPRLVGNGDRFRSRYPINDSISLLNAKLCRYAFDKRARRLVLRRWQVAQLNTGQGALCCELPQFAHDRVLNTA